MPLNPENPSAAHWSSIDHELIEDELVDDIDKAKRDAEIRRRGLRHTIKDTEAAIADPQRQQDANELPWQDELERYQKELDEWEGFMQQHGLLDDDTTE